MIERLRARRLPVAPEEGWLSLLFLLVMAGTLAWSIDDVGWVLGRTDWTDFLLWAAIGGVLSGFVSAKVGWNRWVAHLIGATFAALIVPVMVGGVLLEGGDFGARFGATAAASIRAWQDLVVNSLQATRQTGHYLLVFGLLVWGTAQFASFALYRHRRPLSAVVVIGAFLVGNMAATIDDQLEHLILFSVASLFLLIRLHALDEESAWLRRRIGDPSTVSSLYLRGGTVFIIVAVIGSLALTATARSNPLAGAWEDVKPWLLDVSTAIQRFLPAGVESRGIGAIQFGPSAPIQNVWSTSDALAVTIQRPAGDKTPYYWRAIAYDQFNFYGWDWSDRESQSARLAGEELLTGTLDAPPSEKGIEFTFTVTPDTYRSNFILSPLAPVAVDRDAQYLALGDEGFFKAVQIGGGSTYTVTARVPVLDDVPGGITENLLRVAGTTYPAEIADHYLQLPDGAIGPEAREVLDDVLARIEQDPVLTDNPYDVAKALVRELQSSRFHYDPNVLDVECGDRSGAECFAWSKQGFCQQYATLMTTLLREHDIPARYVQGFLPGTLDERTGTELIYNRDGHAWVEVWFPGHGWVSFDPTGGGIAEAAPLPSGRPVASAPPTASPSFSSGGPLDEDGPNPRRTFGTGAGAPGPRDRGPGAGLILAVGLVIAAAVMAIAFFFWRRGPRGPVTPDGVYSGVARLAARFGFGPRPTQTAYEYAASLGDVLPNIRPELETVAAAKVEVAYGRRTLGAERMDALRESYRRLRVALLRLLLRRRGRGRR
jgi:transglutaminase-like putative cysteine protease